MVYAFTTTRVLDLGLTPCVRGSRPRRQDKDTNNDLKCRFTHPTVQCHRRGPDVVSRTPLPTPPSLLYEPEGPKRFRWASSFLSVSPGAEGVWGPPSRPETTDFVVKSECHTESEERESVLPSTGLLSCPTGPTTTNTRFTVGTRRTEPDLFPRGWGVPDSKRDGLQVSITVTQGYGGPTRETFP